MTAPQVKEWLLAYRDRFDEIDASDELLRRLQSQATRTTTALDGMPHGGGYRDSGRAALLLDQLESVRTSLRALTEQQERQRKLIETAALHVKKSEHRSAVRLRYLADSKWTDVAQSMFGHLDDFELHEDSYLRRITKGHASALEQMAAYLTQQGYTLDESGEMQKPA